MKTIRKIITSSLFFALAVLVGGSCLYPMLGVQAATMTQAQMAEMSTDEHVVPGQGCFTGQDSRSCVSTPDENNFGSCALSCVGSLSKTGVIKKASEGPSLSGAYVVPNGTAPIESDHSTAPGVWAQSGNDPGVLLSVAKKE
ncbi:MAG: hypothetical protein Q8O53_03525 [Candidatus Moranbacteria bacterium]|nr:hypothetical protein [Candidatus Moranbacteria bacterium]